MTREAYRVGDFQDAAGEVERLRRQATLVASAEDAVLRALGFPDEGLGVDLGCGPGFVAARLRGARPRLRLMGVDRDAAVLGQARQALPAVRADAVALPLQSSSLDLVHARVALRYVARPELALAEVARVLRPGGRVFVIDTDDGTLVLEPPPAGFAELTAARQATLRRRSSDPCFARNLPRLLAGAGFDDVGGRSLPVNSLEIGAEAFASIILAPTAEAVDSDLLPAPVVAAAAQAIRAWARAPGSFGMMSALVVSARKREERR